MFDLNQTGVEAPVAEGGAPVWPHPIARNNAGNNSPKPEGGAEAAPILTGQSPAERFLRLLGKDPAATWFRTIPRGKGSNRRRSGRDLHGFNATALEADNRTGEAVYFITGDADQVTKNGVSGADVTCCRAVFVEWDKQPIEWQLTAWQELGLPEPTAMVTTGGKSIHCYWRLQEPMAPDQWRGLQRRLIEYAGGDKVCKDPNRPMRLPGFRYVDKTTGTVTDRVAELIHQADVTYSAAEIEACLPAPEPTAPPAPLLQPLNSELPPRGVEAIRDAVAVLPPRRKDGGTYEQDRNAICGCSAALAEAGVADPDAEAVRLMAHLWEHGERQAAQIIGSTTTRNAAAFWAIAAEHGFDLKRRDLKRQTTSDPASPPTKQQSKPAPLTFEQRWELLELHAAEMACSTWPVMKTVASLACKASELEIPRLGQRQLEQLLEHAQRKVRAKSEPVMGGGTFTIQPTPWAVDGLFRHGLNLLVGQSGAGKSRLAAACMASWLRGDATWLQRRLHGIEARNRHALIIGTDQSLTDWHLTLGPVGLTSKVSDTEVRVHDRVTLYGLESGLQLDADGLNTIRRWVDAHPGGMVVIDSLSACLPPGTDEDKSSAARPVHQLQEVLGDAWAILTHHTRKGAGKEGNIGVGAGRGSGAIDAAVSRVIGLGLIHKMENGQMVAQESDPRRELLSTKRGGKTEHLIVSSDASGFWDLHGTADALKAKERQERVLANLTDAQSDVLGVIEASDQWLTTRDVVEGLGEEYDHSNSRAASTRKVLKRLEVLGLIESRRVGVERTFRTTPNHTEQREVEKKGSDGSGIAAEGISLARVEVREGSEGDSEPPAHTPNTSEPSEPLRTNSEPASEPSRSLAPKAPSHPNHLALSEVPASGSEGGSGLPVEVRSLRTGEWEPGWLQIGSGRGSASVLCRNPQGQSQLIGKKEIRPAREVA